VALDRRLTRVQYSGDTDSAKGQLFSGMLVLNGVREQIRLSQTGLKQCRMERRFANGTIIQAVSSYGREQINIYCVPRGVVVPLEIVEEKVFVGGFICHPRSQNEVDVYVVPAGLYGQPAMDVVAIDGGWTKDKEGVFTELVTTYDYPLVDSDNASFLLTGGEGGKEIISGYFLGGNGDYGNIYWHNNKTDDTLSIVSYKGIPTRHFPLTQQNNITGADFATNGLGYAIYKNGVLLINSRIGYDGSSEAITGIAELDGQVICCTSSGVAIYQGGDKKWVDIPIIGWVTDVAWFFDSTGTKAINSTGTHILTFVKDDDGKITGSQSVNYVQPTGNFLYLTSTLQTGGSTAEYHADGITQESCFELKANGDVGKLNMVGSLVATSEYASDSSSSYADWAIYGGGSCTVTIDGPDINGIVCASLTGSPPGAECGPITCSLTGATLIAGTCCGTLPNAGCYPTNETITVTASFSGSGFSCSGSKTFTVAAKAGHWSSPGICSAFYLTGAPSITGQTPCYNGGTVEGYDPGACTGTQSDQGPTMCETFDDWGPGGFGAYDGGHTSSLGTYTQYIKLLASLNYTGGSPPCFCAYGLGATYANIVDEHTVSWSGYYYVQTTGPCAGKVFPWGGDWCSTDQHAPYGVPMSYTSKSGSNMHGGTVTYSWICT
jgi:hypothetical protein